METEGGHEGTLDVGELSKRRQGVSVLQQSAMIHKPAEIRRSRGKKIWKKARQD